MRDLIACLETSQQIKIRISIRNVEASISPHPLPLAPPQAQVIQL
jgi:hypothetical protein